MADKAEGNSQRVGSEDRCILKLTEFLDEIKAQKKMTTNMNTFSFMAKIIPSANEEKALSNKAYCNPGTKFEGAWYYMPSTTYSTLNENASLCVLYDETVPEGCIEVGLFNRLFYSLEMGETYAFTPASMPKLLAECTLEVSPIKMDGTVLDDTDIDIWRAGLGWQHLVQGRALAARVQNSTYKCIPRLVLPDGAGILDTNTILTILQVKSLK